MLIIIKNLRPFPFNSVFLKHLTSSHIDTTSLLNFPTAISVLWLFRALLIHQFQVYEVSSGYWHFFLQYNTLEVNWTMSNYLKQRHFFMDFLLLSCSLLLSRFPPSHFQIFSWRKKKTHHIAVSFWNILYLPVFLQACRCWSRGPSPGPSSSRRASERGVSGKCGGVSGVGRRWLWRSSPPVRSAPGSARLRSTRLWCWDTRTFWASSLLTTKVRLLRLWAAGLRYNCTSTCGERLVGKTEKWMKVWRKQLRTSPNTIK